MKLIFGYIKKNSDLQFIRFLVVGVLNTLFGYSIFALFIYLHFNYILAAFFATLIGIVFNFYTVGHIVFSSHKVKQFYRFIVVYVAVYLVNVLALYIFNLFSVSNYIAGAILILPLACLAFILQKIFVFV